MLLPKKSDHLRARTLFYKKALPLRKYNYDQCIYQGKEQNKPYSIKKGLNASAKCIDLSSCAGSTDRHGLKLDDPYLFSA